MDGGSTGQGHCPQRAIQPFSRSWRYAGVAKASGRPMSAHAARDLPKSFMMNLKKRDSGLFEKIWFDVLISNVHCSFDETDDE